MDIIEVFERFPTQADCLAYLEGARWGGKPKCPYCKSAKVSAAPKELRQHCNTCNTTFSVTVGTIFHKTHLPMQKWLLAVSLVLGAKKGISARQLARHLHVNRNTAWRMEMKIREAMIVKEQRELLSGIVEMDETYMGGKPRKESPQGPHHKRGRGTDRPPVVGIVERGGSVKAKIATKHDLNFGQFADLIRRNVDTEKSVLMTDEFRGYLGVSSFMPHFTINHKQVYSDGIVHTNTIESFWSLLKRGIIGQYHRVSLRHLPRYVDEFCYRWDHRKDPEIFVKTIQKALGATR